VKNIIFFFVFFSFLFTITSLSSERRSGNEFIKIKSATFRVDEKSPAYSTGKVLNFNLYVEQINQNWENGAWVNDTRDIDQWNPAMTQVEVISQEWVNDKWENKSKHVASVSINMSDSTMRFLQVQLYAWAGNAWIIQMQSAYVYDSNNYLTQVNTQLSMGGNFIPFQQTDFTNNSAGLPLTEIHKQLNFQTMQLEDYRKYVYTYHSTNQKYLETETNAYFINSAWVDTGKTTYTRNSMLNELTEIFQDIYGGSTFVNAWMYEYTYNSTGEHCTSQLGKYWNSNQSTWDYSSRWTATYDANWNMTLELGENFIGGNYSPSWRTSYTYNSSGDETLSQTEFYHVTEGWELASQSITYYSPSSVAPDLSQPVQFTLNQNYPNPFNPSTVISYSITSPSDVKLTVYDVLGNQITELVNGFQSPGTHSINFNADGLSSGVYFYKLQAGNLVSVKQMMLIK